MEIHKRDWADLPFDLLVVLARRFQCIKDLCAFRAVCVSWRSAASKENFNQTRQLPLLLNEYNVDKSNFTLDSLAEFFDCGHSPAEIYAPMISTHGRNVGTYFRAWRGWLLVVEENEFMYLLHIFSQTKIQLPIVSSLKELQWGDEPIIVHKVVISASPLTTQDYTVLIRYARDDYIAFWKPGDKLFTRILSFLKSDIMCYNGVLYSISVSGYVQKYIFKPDEEDYIDVPTDWNNIITEPAVTNRAFIKPKFNFVESGGDLLVVVQMQEECMITDKWRLPKKVYVRALCEYDELCESIEWTEIKDLGNRAIFIGSNSFSVDASQIPGCRANCIYFIQDLEMPLTRSKSLDYEKLYDYRIGTYNLTDGRVEYSCARNGLPLWFIPSFH